MENKQVFEIGSLVREINRSSMRGIGIVTYVMDQKMKVKFGSERKWKEVTKKRYEVIQDDGSHWYRSLKRQLSIQAGL